MLRRLVLLLALLLPSSAFAQHGDGSGYWLGGGGSGSTNVNDIGDPTWFKFHEDNVRLWLDLDQDGLYDTGEPILNECQPTNLNGDVTCDGNFLVVGDFDVGNVPDALEDTLYSFRTASGTTGVASGGAIPGPDDCYPMFGEYTLPLAAAGADPSGSCEHAIATDLFLTEVCVTYVTGTAPTNNCILQFYEKGERVTPGPHATFNVGAAGAELDSVGDTKCVDVNVDVDDAPESFYFQADTDAADCDATTNWPELEVLVRGYRVNIP